MHLPYLPGRTRTRLHWCHIGVKDARHRSACGIPQAYEKDRDDDLLWWAGVVDRFLFEERTVFAYANNHYQNHAPSTEERFLELRRGDR